MADLTDVIIDGDPYDEDENGGWFVGATALTDGEQGDVPKPLAGDEDKVLQGSGVWGKKLQIDIIIQNGVYGYIGANDTFIPFKSQADIDAAVSAARVGNATAADVLEGKTFTNSTTSGVTGTMPSRSNGEDAVSTDRSNGNRVFFPRGHYPNYATHDGQSYVKVTDAQIVNFANKQEKTVTSSTSAQTVTPDSGKLLSKVTVNAMTNLSSITRYQHASNNGTPTILGDAGFFTTVYDKTSKANLGDYFEIRYNGSPNKDTSNNTTGNGYISTNTLFALPSQTKSVTPSTSAQTVSPDSNKVLKSVTVNAIPTQRSASGQASGNKCWTWNNRVYFGIDYGWYPSGNSYGSMSNVCERYVDYSKVASALGITGSTVRAGSTIIGVSGTAQDGIYNVTGHGTKLDMGANNTYRYVNTQKAYDAGYAAGRAQGRADTQGGVCIQIRVQNGSGATITAGWRWASEDWHTIRDGKSWSISGTDAYVAKSYKVRYNSPPMIPE